MFLRTWRFLYSNSISRRIQLRQLWVQSTSTLPTLSDAIHECYSQQAIKSTSISTTLKEKAHLLFVSSQGYHGSDIQRIPYALQTCSNNTQCTIGTVIELPSFPHPKVILWTYLNECDTDSKVDEVIFSFKDHTRHFNKEKAVGRWPPSFQIPSSQLPTDKQPSFSSVSRSPNVDVSLTSTLKRYKKRISSEFTFIILSDKNPHFLIEALDIHFPSNLKLGFIGSPTPFLTGKSVCLFTRDDILDQGTIGLVLPIPPFVDALKQQQYKLNHTLKAISGVLEITKCQGNVILEIASRNATSSLMQDNIICSKETLFFLALLDQEKKVLSYHKITSGDPYRGFIAIDSIFDLHPGNFVQFFMLNPNSDIHSPGWILSKEIESIYSENGLVIGLPHSKTWICNIPNASLSLE